jgi:hypothetical protein
MIGSIEYLRHGASHSLPDVTFDVTGDVPLIAAHHWPEWIVDGEWEELPTDPEQMTMMAQWRSVLGDDRLVLWRHLTSLEIFQQLAERQVS